MRLHSSLVSLLFVCAGAGAIAQASAAPTCADLKLVPAVRECTAVRSISIGSAGLRIVSDKNAEDEFAANDLEESLKERGIAIGKANASTIHFERVSLASAKDLAEKREEAYKIEPTGEHDLTISAETGAGVFYGAQTVKQLIRGFGKDAVLLMPTIRDWPAVAHRGLSDDWSRGPLPNMDFLKREIRTLAAYKYNIFSPYFEHTFAYASTPVAAFPGGAFTPDQGRELVEYAARYHITIIPEQEAFGHLHHVLKFEQYSTLGETPRGAVLARAIREACRRLVSGLANWPRCFPVPMRTSARMRPTSLGWAARTMRLRRRDWARST
jgi:hexosaminidase